MKKHVISILLGITITACIPVSFAPDFNKKGYKVKEAQRFKRKLPEQQAFIFEDTKEADAFYDFINTKFELNDLDVDFEVPFRIEGQLYYLSFYEVEKSTTAIDLFNITDELVHEVGTWYIVITVIDNDSKDGLKASHPKHQLILQYLKDLRQEYLDVKEKEVPSKIKKS
ncbi:hypothetical protein [Winogradskyella sp.]|uniref:hypothetical protein n=1 Tax=Winogradskyella sp. TaxID=1883156 RepID=UPI003BAD8807